MVSQSDTPAIPVKRQRGRPRGGTLLVTRDDVVQAAMRAVRRHGPTVTMESIAAEAGVSKPIIYRMVGDRSAVAAAVAEFVTTDINDTVKVNQQQPGTPAEVFAGIVRAMFQGIADDVPIFMFVEHGLGADQGTQLQLLVEMSAQRYIEGMAEWENPLSDAPSANRTFGYAMVGALRTVAMMWIHDEYCDIDDLVDQMTEMFMRVVEG